jgi:hypothetical protein
MQSGIPSQFFPPFDTSALNEFTYEIHPLQFPWKTQLSHIFLLETGRWNTAPAKVVEPKALPTRGRGPGSGGRGGGIPLPRSHQLCPAAQHMAKTSWKRGTIGGRLSHDAASVLVPQDRSNCRLLI